MNNGPFTFSNNSDSIVNKSYEKTGRPFWIQTNKSTNVIFIKGGIQSHHKELTWFELWFYGNNNNPKANLRTIKIAWWVSAILKSQIRSKHYLFLSWAEGYIYIFNTIEHITCCQILKESRIAQNK